MPPGEGRSPDAASVARHDRAWDQERCACGANLVGCHGCAEMRCLTCDPYTEYERLNRCCVSRSVPAREHEGLGQAGRAVTRPAGPHAAYRHESLKDEGPKRKYARYVVLAPDGSVVRTYTGSFASADARNEAQRLNRLAAKS